MREFFFEGSKQPEVECLHLDRNPQYSELLENNSLRELTDFMALSRENSFRDVPCRLTVGLDLLDGVSSQRVYLKRHWSEKKGKSLSPHEEAQSEADNISLLQSYAIPVPELVASGWGYVNKRSVGFVAMKEVPGLQGDHFIEQNQKLENWSKIQQGFIVKLADLAAKFHGEGFNHRDFYLCHFFVDLQGEETSLNLIDLQRVQKRRTFRQRWVVKDLAQMCYSSLKLVNNSARLKFFLQYRKSAKLNAADKKLIRKILKKTATMVKREKDGKIR